MDRSLPIAMVARQWFKEMTDTQPTSVHFALQQLRLSVAHIKHHGYTSISMEAPARLSSPRSIKPEQSKITTRKRSDEYSNEKWLEQFLSYKTNEGIRYSSVQQLGARSRLFLSILNKPISQITSKDAIDFKTHLITSSKAYKTQKETLSAVKQFVKWLKLQDVLSTSPFDGVTIKQPTIKASEERQRWSHDALARLFKHDNFKTIPNELTPQAKREDFWIPLILLFSGARTGEICQLKTRDIILHKGTWCLDINDRGEDRHLKTAASKRLVPIHRKLIDWGVLEYVEYRRKHNKVNLFDLTPTGPDNDWYKRFSVRFARVLTSMGFVGKQRPTLHSFRHTFIDELQQQGVPENETSELVGHTKRGIAYGRYGKTVNIERLNNVVQTLRFNLPFAF
ncbi:tyrosine-type recombinase/integrase [Vibrio vulnificus]|nr:tyrosine-type recombinase/integrase [Vibrio vulnificus]